MLAFALCINTYYSATEHGRTLRRDMFSYIIGIPSYLRYKPINMKINIYLIKPIDPLPGRCRKTRLY